MAVGLTAAATMVMTACGSSDSGGGGGSSTSPKPGSSNADGSDQSLQAAFNAATIGFVNKSDKKGGSLNLLATGDCDAWDPANTYYGWCWNMQRLFTRTLVGYSSYLGPITLRSKGIWPPVWALTMRISPSGPTS